MERESKFGKHNNPLIKAIEKEDFDRVAEIIDTANGDDLNDGPYEHIPLHLALADYRFCSIRRNLWIAKLLVEAGANPNLQIFRQNWSKNSQSPFQELVFYYISLKYYLQQERTYPLELQSLTYAYDLNGILCKPEVEDCKRLLNQANLLIDIFLKNGADPNTRTNNAYNKTVFHYAINQDKDLALKLLKTGIVQCNVCDCHNYTPLMSTICSHDDVYALELYDAMLDTGVELNLNALNCHDENVFWQAVESGSGKLALRLKNDGAEVERFYPLLFYMHSMMCCDDPITEFFTGTFLKLSSPLLSPFLRTSKHINNYYESSNKWKEVQASKDLVDAFVKSPISSLVDASCFDTVGAKNDMDEFIKLTNFSNLLEKFPTTELIHLMFGRCSASLQQLCVRSIFRAVFPSSNSNVTCIVGCPNVITPDNIRNLVLSLGLPIKLIPFFEIEVAKYQVCAICVKLNIDSAPSIYSDGSMRSIELYEESEFSLENEESDDFSCVSYGSGYVSLENEESDNCSSLGYGYCHVPPGGCVLPQTIVPSKKSKYYKYLYADNDSLDEEENIFFEFSPNQHGILEIL